MNVYTTEFFARCPTNQVRVKYTLRIETRSMLNVEAIVDAVEDIGEGYHEEIADQLLVRFSGAQTLIADHHGVRIETTRASTEIPAS